MINRMSKLLVSFLFVSWSALAQSNPRISTFAGTGEIGYSGDGGPARKAKLNNPFGIARGPDGALYICDMGNHVIRRVSIDGQIATVAGTGKAGYSGDGGVATKAELLEPYEVRFDQAGNLYGAAQVGGRRLGGADPPPVRL